MSRLKAFELAVALAVTACAASAQSIISAQSGLLHYYEGEVTLNGKVVAAKFGEFPQVKSNQAVETGLGRAEVMLTPGVTLRLGETSGVRMLSARLQDTRLEFQRGSAIVEVVEPIRSDQVTFSYQGAEFPLEKEGLYRLESNPPSLQVYQGQVEVRQNGQTFTVKSGRMLNLSTLLVEKFDAKHGDALYRWAKRRSEQLAVANISSARSMRGSSGRSGWVFNPYFGTLTFVPGYGQFMSPFGWSFWSPFSVNQFYYNYFRPAYGRGSWANSNNASSGWSRVPASPSMIHQSERAAGVFSGSSGGSPSTPMSSAPSAVSSPRSSAGGAGISGGGGRSAGGGGMGGRGR